VTTALVLVLALPLIVAGCTETIHFGDAGAGADAVNVAGLVSLAITPAHPSITISGLDEPMQTVPFTATGTFMDGSTSDVTSRVVWSVDNPLPGMIGSNGVYATSNAAGGHVTVRATASGVTATASITVEIDATIVDSTFPPAGDPGTLFPAGAAPITDAMKSPAITYPANHTAFPQGVASTLVQFMPGMGNDTFRISFDNDVLHLVVFSSGQRWAAIGTVWSVVAASGIDQPVELTIEGTSSSAPGTIYASAADTLTFSPDTPGGVIYFWSAATTGVVRGDLGALSASQLYPSTGSGACVGCHAVSRDASAMAMGYGNEMNAQLQTIALSNLDTVISSTANLAGGWSTFSPDDSLVLTAHAGVLALDDARTGAPVGGGSGVVALPAMTFATHPDWSPDGSNVAVTLTTMKPNDTDVNGGSIALLPFAAGHFGTPRVLVASSGNENNYFPRWSPDGAYLAYVHATMSSHNAMTAELRIVPAAGGTPTVLTSASYNAGSTAGLSDTMPVWAPVQGQMSWLAFASPRPYGTVMPGGNQAQIWIAGVDLSALGSGADPSFAAFWLPCQNITVVNNNPVWSRPTENVDRAPAPGDR
jgi:TolB protein